MSCRRTVSVGRARARACEAAAAGQDGGPPIVVLTPVFTAAGGRSPLLECGTNSPELAEAAEFGDKPRACARPNELAIDAGW